MMFYFQQDETPSHFAGKVQNCVKFSPDDGLGTEDIQLPPRSPDLMPLDTLLWSHLKHHTISDLKENTVWFFQY